MTERSARFAFGSNWERFVRKHFSEERVAASQQQLLAFLDTADLRGRSFLDIGCGSGIHSLAALRSGAAAIVSFDYDPVAVETTRRVRDYAGGPDRWSVLQGSVLDEAFMSGLEKADVVYSWGVLHHTGDLWRAMDLAASRCKPGGWIYLALYDYEHHDRPPEETPEMWLEVKQAYNRAGWWGKRRLELWYVWAFMISRNPLWLPVVCYRLVRNRRSRGMAFYTDLVDWLGGWPMEFARREDVQQWAARKNLTMLKMKTGEANTEYLFRAEPTREVPASDAGDVEVKG
ncbi:MAG TPA: class I SAM-dependent methyltransferase [Thermoanaerobaculaceae bacterium]|nr:class I SAM-dependent methyltransferase [Thermoanaerobaculaceae bacterium]HPS78840.1 class I SAM-dependent methyltransferase [Thermoanaerobaculaceae bacterium]